MISMQRSLSSPVRIHSSDPVSLDDADPSTVKPPSTPPTPPPSDPRVDLPQPVHRPRSRSRSPSQTISSLPIRRSEDNPRQANAHAHPRTHSSTNTASNEARKPLVAQDSQPPSPGGPSDMDRPAYSPTPSPPTAPIDGGPVSLAASLIPDLSLYSNSFQTQENEGTTLEELAHLVRLSKYQERKRASTRIRLQRSLISTALSARLTRCGEIARRNLADYFRKDNKAVFAPLYNAIHDVRKSCDELRRYALLEPELDAINCPVPPPPPSDASDVGPDSSFVARASSSLVIAPFLNDVSASARETFLGFLTQIRTNPDYLATRLCSLNTSELNALTNFHHVLEPIESVLPVHGHGRSATGSRSQSGSASGRHGTTQQNAAIERLLSFQRHDPLSALIHTCFANSAGPDSAEDRRRTDAWATALARLITESKANKVHSEHMLIYVLNVWTAMRDWAGKSKMEWFLMKILEEGAFLLDRAEDQHGTRFNLADWTAKDSEAADRFYDRAVHELFDIIDDEDATGVPEGLIELGNAILARIDPMLVDSTRNWFVWKWLFSSFLLHVMIHPESYGMMAEYHISEYGRQTILKKVALRAQELVVNMTCYKKGISAISPRIQAHVENILNKFRGGKSQKHAAKLLPARSITSLRETVEVHPYLVISPADLVTMVNALFPEKRPMSAQSSSMRSVAPSVSAMSGLSQPISMAASRSNFETTSVLSTSASSFLSDATTSRETALDDQRTGSPSRYSPPTLDLRGHQRFNNYEDDGYRLRFALRELSATLGMDVMQGSCHPCAERWAVLFVSPDGNSLSTQMAYDPEDEVEDDENSSTTDTDEDDVEGRPELDKGYHQLRDSILRLVQDFEIPQSVEPEGSRAQFSNRATGIKRYRSKNKVITTEKSHSVASNNPYRRRGDAVGHDTESRRRVDSPGRRGSASATDSKPGHTNNGDSSDSPSVLITMLAAASSQSQARSDFVSAHMYWKTLQQLKALTSPSLRRDGFAVLLDIFSRGPRDSIRRCASAIEQYDAWLVWLKQSQERHEGLIDAMTKRLRSLRDKMWYVSDVRTSGPYEHSRSICAALKTMGMPRRWGAYQRSNRGAPSSARGQGQASNYIHRTETQMMDLLSASEDQGGPNKLKDDQADNTSRWLKQTDIANFCRGEERIHRFCCEIDTCISKLIGESMMDGPVLWSSELYLRDRRALEGSKGGGRERDQLWPQGGVAGDDGASVVSESERKFGSFGRSSGLRALSAHNLSQQSLESGSYRYPRGIGALSDIIDGQDYFGASSPVHTIDSSSTFWSPFQSTMAPSSVASRAHSPTTSVTNLSSLLNHPPYPQPAPSFSSQSTTARPTTSASSIETAVYQQRLSEDKSRFFTELRQTLTSLLLSDLGTFVFASGSETDAWFETLGQECIERRDSLDRRAKEAKEAKEAKDVSTAVLKCRPPKSSGKIRVIEKKKSFGNLRDAGEADRLSDITDAASSHDRGGSAASETSSNRGRSRATKDTKDTGGEFPYKQAYKRLLRMFSIHPNPYAKMNALFELEQLIVASLASGTKRARFGWKRSNMSSTDSDGGGTGPGRPGPLGYDIDNVKERRSHALQQSPAVPPAAAGPHQARYGASEPSRSGGPSAQFANREAVTDVLRSLLRDKTIRPKTLFRDLQFIAAFVRPTVLDETEKGMAFWDTGYAALVLKSEVCQTMLGVADEVQKAFRVNKGGIRDVQLPDADLPPPPSSPPPVTSTYTLADAGRMWTILAKEGDTAAQRELALFYLIDPELLERTTLPLSKPREVFKQAVIDKYGRGSGHSRTHRFKLGDRSRASGLQGSMQETGAEERATVATDPSLMCIAVHFFQAAEQGGDGPATRFLREHELI
ncbi:hypothetical protein ACRALDRAFT_1064593 [Sodiomyces alcalophilus JCM 7366]|uniref:uncharacterized protein n=1 Tax=Sodiomyces alcalophilus JCM 7366 TaxID=591952 RepID=UPI0039B54577